MTAQPRKMSEIMKEISETLLRHPGGIPSYQQAEADTQDERQGNEGNPDYGIQSWAAPQVIHHQPLS